MRALALLAILAVLPLAAARPAGVYDDAVVVPVPSGVERDGLRVTIHYNACPTASMGPAEGCDNGRSFRLVPDRHSLVRVDECDAQGACATMAPFLPVVEYCTTDENGERHCEDLTPTWGELPPIWEPHHALP